MHLTLIQCVQIFNKSVSILNHNKNSFLLNVYTSNASSEVAMSVTVRTDCHSLAQFIRYLQF